MPYANWRTKVALAVLGAALAGAAQVQAQSGDAILDLLIKKGVINQREANEVREQLDQEAVKSQEVFNKTKVSSWVDSLKWSGDFRLRSEFFDNEDQTGASVNDRWRFRYRLRLQLDAQMLEWTKVTLRLASGAADDPVSTNQSLTDTFRKKPIFVDAAFVTIQPPGWDWMKVIGGKMDLTSWQPKFNSPMVYDFDTTPEGLAEQFTYSFGDKKQFTVFGNFGQYVLREQSGNYSDAYLLDFQGGVSAWFMGNDAKAARLKLTGAGGFYYTEHIDNAKYAFGDSPNTGNANGVGALTNSVPDNFQVFSARGEASYLISERPFLGTPALLTISGEYDVNLAKAFDTMANSSQKISPDQTIGWTVQAVFGEAKKKGQWQVAYQYKYLGADAVFDALTDSDWGYGGTDRKGHVIKAAYNLQDWWQLGAAAIMTDKISGRSGGHNMKGDGSEMLRLQIDTVIKF